MVGRPMGWFSTRFQIGRPGPGRAFGRHAFAGQLSSPPWARKTSLTNPVAISKKKKKASRRPPPLLSPHQLRRRPAIFRLASPHSHRLLSSSVPHLPRCLVPPPGPDGPNLQRSSCARAHPLHRPSSCRPLDLLPVPTKKKRRFPGCFSSGCRKIDPRVLT